MKTKISKWSVYTIVNNENKVEYVGCTSNPKHRFYRHKHWYQHSGIGKFAGRDDVRMEIIREFDNRWEALDFEEQLKLDLGLSHLSERTGTGLMPIKKVIAYSATNGNQIGIYNSISEAARKLDIGFRSISANIKGRCKVVDKKYQFKLLEN
jgi:predicted GIY-YIG superfamily endonuclease